MEGSVAKVKSATKSDWLKVVRAEERSNLLRDLIKEGLGTNDVENFMLGQVGLRTKLGKGTKNMWEMDRNNVMNLMKAKLENSVEDEGEKRSSRNKARARLERLLSRKKNDYKKFIHKVRDKVGKERRMLKKRNKNKVRAIRMKRKKETVALLPKLIERYEECRIFRQDGGEFVAGEVRGPVIVGEDPTVKG